MVPVELLPREEVPFLEAKGVPRPQAAWHDTGSEETLGERVRLFRGNEDLVAKFPGVAGPAHE